MPVDDIYNFQITVNDEPANFSFKWESTPGTIRGQGPPITADMDQDGKLDTLFIAGLYYPDYAQNIHTRIILSLNAADGTENWRVINQGAEGYPRGLYLNPLEIYDINNDGIPEIFTAWGDLSHRYGEGMACLNAITGQPIWVNWDHKPVWHHFVIIADKNTNIPYVYFNGHDTAGDSFSMNKIDARDGTLIKKIMPAPGSCNGGLSAADIDGDGNVEIIIGAHSSTAYPTTCYDTDLNIIWKANVATYSSTQCPQLVDINNDGVLDVVALRQCSAGAMSGGITVLDGNTGQRMDEYSENNLGIGTHEHGSIIKGSDGYYLITTGYSGPSHVVKIKPNPEVLGRIGSDIGWEVSSPPQWANVVGDSNIDITRGGYNFHGYPPYDYIGSGPGVGAFHINDVDGDGFMELFGSRSSRNNVACYDSNQYTIPGLNTYTSYFGFRHLKSIEVYEPCPGTYWNPW